MAALGVAVLVAEWLKWAGYCRHFGRAEMSAYPDSVLTSRLAGQSQKADIPLDFGRGASIGAVTESRPS